MLLGDYKIKRLRNVILIAVSAIFLSRMVYVNHQKKPLQSAMVFFDFMIDSFDKIHHR